MKKILFIVSIIFFSVFVYTDVQAGECPYITSYDRVKMNGGTAVYMITGETSMSAYPTDKVYKDWHENYSAVKSVPRECLENFTVTNYVMPRPGTFVQKMTQNGKMYPSVYMMFLGNGVKKIRDVADAKYFGVADWESRIIPIPEVYFSFLDVQGIASDFAIGTLLEDEDNPGSYYVLDEDYSFVSLKMDEYFAKKVPKLRIRKEVPVGEIGTEMYHPYSVFDTKDVYEYLLNPAQVGLKKSRVQEKFFDCGHQSWKGFSCMADRAVNCENTLLQYSPPMYLATGEGMDEGSLTEYKLYKREDGQCIFYSENKKFDIVIDGEYRQRLKDDVGDTDAEIDAWEKQMEESVEGGSFQCLVFDTSDLISVFNNWTAGYFTTSDYDNFSCSGWGQGDYMPD
ncbi:MAG: hypothetical protein V1848_00395 [Candidatus Magasanikbacteria bacterium]